MKPEGLKDLADPADQPSVTEAPRPLRRDAERNRQRILTAAVEVINERGLEVSLDEVARRAGVGVGTVYRRFGTKDELVEALFVDRIESIAAWPKRPSEHPIPGRAWCPSWSRWPRRWPATSGCGTR